jgi:hypothetical protein
LTKIMLPNYQGPISSQLTPEKNIFFPIGINIRGGMLSVGSGTNSVSSFHVMTHSCIIFSIGINTSKDQSVPTNIAR